MVSRTSGRSNQGYRSSVYRQIREKGSSICALPRPQTVASGISSTTLCKFASFLTVDCKRTNQDCMRFCRWWSYLEIESFLWKKPNQTSFLIHFLWLHAKRLADWFCSKRISSLHIRATWYHQCRLWRFDEHTCKILPCCRDNRGRENTGSSGTSRLRISRQYASYLISNRKRAKYDHCLRYLRGM